VINSDPDGSEPRASLGDMLDRNAGEGYAQRKADVYMARAEAERAARQAGYKSPLRRLIERLFPAHQERGS
jgi:hypothetical protein